MDSRTLTLRELNRTTLARQFLLEKTSNSVPETIERLVGLQAQALSAPFVGLWTRVSQFSQNDLANLIQDRTVLKATMMRGTLHLVTAADYLRFRTTLQPMLELGAAAILKSRGPAIDKKKVLKIARDYFNQEPRSFAEITNLFGDLMPDVDPGAVRYTIRTHLPLVQVPISAGWSYSGNPKFTLAETWIGRAISPDDNLRELVFRYLTAFGPASVTDIQTWCGFPKLRDALERLRPELHVYRDEQRRELFDLQRVALSDALSPAPERFLPEYDNLLLSHQKRTRVIADEHRSRVYLPGLRVRSTFLVDGFVRGAWKVEKTKLAATLLIEPFDELTKHSRRSLTDEAEKLVRFVEPDAKSYEVRFDP
jgi:hypothetical protein